MHKYTSELGADELGTNETPNVMTVGVENNGLNCRPTAGNSMQCCMPNSVILVILPA
jgi:hypothetical protein